MGVPEDSEEDSVPETRAVAVPSTTRSRGREITDAEVEGFLSSAPAMVHYEIFFHFIIKITRFRLQKQNT